MDLAWTEYRAADVPAQRDLVVTNWESKAMLFFFLDLFCVDAGGSGRFLYPALLCLVFVAKFHTLRIT